MQDNKMTQYNVDFLHEDDHAGYNSFIHDSPEALYEHSLEIKNLITNYFKFTPRYLVAKLDNNIVGALPLFMANSLIEGKRYVSIPFFPFGGVIGIDDECKKALLEKAKEISKDGKFLEIRQKEVLDENLSKDFVRQSPITDFLIELKYSEKEMFDSFSKDVRYDIRKAQKNNLGVKIGKDKKNLNDFYNVYLNTRKKRGIPAWPYGLFKEALKTCDTAVAVTYLQDKPIAAAFLFFEKDTIEYAFAGTDYKYNKISPYYLMLWEIIVYGIKNKYKLLDMGGSTKEMNDGNMYVFKEKWATIKREIPYYFYSATPANIPSLKRKFGLYRIYGRVWSKLPKFVIRIISPYVIRQFV